MRLHAVTLLVDDYDEAIAHYVDDLGFTLVEDTPLSPDKRWVRVSPDPDGGTSIVLAVATTDAQRKAIGHQTGGRVGLFLHTDDFDAEHSRLVARGIHMTETPRIEIYGKVIVFRDRYGNLWDLIEPTAKTE
ncbi:MAG: VOC family protein [Actinobacteria bacterium]|nr:VOC family protein [Actinomycetota bacterium]